MITIDENFYSTIYKGNVIPLPLFTSYERKANIKVCSYINSTDEYIDDIKNCICAVAEIIYKYDNGLIKSNESVGDYSVAFVPQSTNFENAVLNEIKMYLGHTGLLFRGVNP